MNRRRFLNRLAAATAAAPLAHAAGATAATTEPFIDTNVWLGSWATRRAGLHSASPLVAKLKTHGVTAAWTGSFDAVLHTDVAGANARLAEACARDGGGVLVPFGAVNPTLPDWEEDVRRCHELHRMPGVRLTPNYHNYELDDPRFARLLEIATRRGLLVQIALALEDDRSQNPVLTAAPVSAAPLVATLAAQPKARVLLLNSGSRVLATTTGLLPRLTAAGVFFEIAMLEGVAGIESLLQRLPAVRLTFGSHTPYFYFEAALLKLQESALTDAQLAAIRSGHARAALGSSL